MSFPFAQRMATEDSIKDVPIILPPSPPGLEALYQACRAVYPDQPNPLQVSTLVKYWLGGMEPLDYISMYRNEGNSLLKVPSHWHYVTFGLSDLHGDGRVHERACNPDEPSGYGFELTFRLRRDPSETTPPLWPASLLQSLAKYVFQSGERLVVGDHVPWPGPLDNSDSAIRAVLLATDAQLQPARSALGTVSFVQIVGATADELKAAQHWSGPGVLSLLATASPSPWLLTDTRRGSVLLADPAAAMAVEAGIAKEGSDLSGVSASFLSWACPSLPGYKIELEIGCGGDRDVAELAEPKTLPDLELTLSHEAAVVLAEIGLTGRLGHGRHFTVKRASGALAATLVSEAVAGSAAGPGRPYVARGPWLHIHISSNDLRFTASALRDALATPKLEFPVIVQWPERGFTIKVVPEVPPIVPSHHPLLNRHPL